MQHLLSNISQEELVLVLVHCLEKATERQSLRLLMIVLLECYQLTWSFPGY